MRNVLSEYFVDFNLFVHYIQCVSSYNAIVSKAVDTNYVRMLDLFRFLSKSEVNKEIFVWATGASCRHTMERQEVHGRIYNCMQ